MMRNFSVILFSLFLISCNLETRSQNTRMMLDAIPHLNKDGVIYPYIRYEYKKNLFEGNGRTFFLFPIFKERNRILVLENPIYERNFKALFSEELLGKDGSIVVKDGIYMSEAFPFSIPVIFKDGMKWEWGYQNAKYECNITAVSFEKGIAKKYSVQCVNKSTNDVLKYKYDSLIGITEYEDYCGRPNICK